MKTPRLVALAALATAHLASAPAHAGVEVGNGGDCIRIKDKIHVLDLVEAGVENNPYFDPQSVGHPEIEKTLTRVLSDLDEAPAPMLARKIQEIAHVEKGLAIALYAAIQFFDWTPVNPDLVDVQDEESPINLDRKNLIQAALRSGRTIRISRDAWKLLNPVNRVALILHEATYALVRPEERSDQFGRTEFYQSSQKAKELNGYFFTEKLKSRGREGLARLTRNLFPMIPSQDPATSLESVRLVMGNTTAAIHHTPRMAVENGEKVWFPRALPSVRQQTAAWKKELQFQCSELERTVIARAIYHVIHLELSEFQSSAGPRDYVKFTVPNRRINYGWSYGNVHDQEESKEWLRKTAYKNQQQCISFFEGQFDPFLRWVSENYMF